MILTQLLVNVLRFVHNQISSAPQDIINTLPQSSHELFIQILAGFITSKGYIMDCFPILLPMIVHQISQQGLPGKHSHCWMGSTNPTSVLTTNKELTQQLTFFLL